MLADESDIEALRKKYGKSEEIKDIYKNLAIE